jgi:hypothetical protein
MSTTTIKIRDKFIKSSRVNKAVAAIQRGEFSNYSKVTKEYKCTYSAVSRQIRGLTKTKKEANIF